MSATNNNKIYLSSPHMSGKEQKYVQEAFDTNWIAPLGPNVDNFEKELAKYCGVEHSAALSSGSAAIHLSLIMLDIKVGDYVLTQSLTFGATAFPIQYQGAIPVFIDSEDKTWNISPELLEVAIIDCMTNGPQKADSDQKLPPAKPKAIIPVHLYGMPYNVEAIHKIAAKYQIPVIEDAAEALGSQYNNKMCASFGDTGILSFNGNKIITTSGGGALLSNNLSLVNKARFLATQSREPAAHYEHKEIGYNYRMSNIVAGIGRGQLEVINDRVARKREIFETYKNGLSEISGIHFPDEPNSDYYSNRWLTTILIDKQKTNFDHNDLRLKLESKNIESRPLWKPMHIQPVFKSMPAYTDGTSEKLFKRGLCLPSGTNMSELELQNIIELIRNFSK